MTNRRALVFLLLSLLLGLGSVAVAAKWINQKINGQTTPMVVAAKDIGPGERLEAPLVKVVNWPAGSRVSGSSANSADFLGRVTAYGISAGEPITEQRLAANGAKAGLNAMISPGYRAMTVKVNEVIGVAGFALPGNYVDILVNVQEGQSKPVSKIVLEKIHVLAIAQEHAIKDETKPRIVNAVTLEVTPEQAERLDLARNVGTLSMVLRNQTDQAPVKTRGAVVADVLNGPQTRTPDGSPASRTPSAGPPTIEIFRGLQRTTVSAG